MDKRRQRPKSRQTKKIVKYRRKPKIAVAIFALVLVYVISFIFIYLSKSKVRTYEVESGTLTTNAGFTGIIIRDETVYNSEYSGNINYYQKEGSRVKVGDTLYTVDETGRVSEILSQYNTSNENSLSKESLATIKSMLGNFRTDYNGNNFDEIYNLKADINATVLHAMNESIMENLDDIISKTGSENLFRTINCENTGIIAYYIDGFEELTCETVKAEDFNTSTYEKTNLKSEKLIVSGNPAYKLINSEDWYIMIPLTKEDIDLYDLADKDAVSIKIKKDNISTTANFSIINSGDKYYGKISLNRYMLRYATERFLDIEIGTASDSGLKIPASAVTENEFYTIPKEFLTKGGNSNDYGFICESYNSSGEAVVKFVAADIYKSTDELCYVSKKDFESGATIIMPDSSKKYTVGPVDKLKGVYCINTGYTSFKLIDIIDQNNEYYIVKKGISHGISTYDRILLDAYNYSDNQMIY
ncbi:MAG: HlyD family efflux transporter periplasmic adaptor subunit [Lachnospira sp.]